jgi:aspartate/methionine/tyrosine aminotransferase
MRGEPDLATPPHIVEACARALRNGRTSYPDNRGERNFRSAVSQKLLRDNNLQLDLETEILATTGATFGMLAPEGGFLAMADVRGIGLPSNEIRKCLMHEHGVVVVHGAAYGPGGEGTLRVSFASGGETLAQGLQRLREGLEHLS